MKLKLFFLLVLTLLIVNSSLLIATVRYVSKTGTSTPPYTSWATAADSIQKCINICSFGDTVYVANGVYKERIDMIPGLSLIGAGMDSCIIDTRDFTLTSPFYSVKIVDSCYFSFFRIITYENQVGFGIRISGNGSIIERNIISEANSAIDIFTNGKNLIQNNYIFNVNEGFSVFFSNSKIINNIIVPYQYGFIANLNSNPTYANNTIIIENANAIAGYMEYDNWYSILKNNTFISLNGGNYGIRSFGDSVINNVVTGSWYHGILTSSNGTTPGIVINNHIGGTTSGIYIADQPLKVQYNNLWKNQFYSLLDSTNIFNDPMFVNEDSSDFHLQMYSPLIDAGDPNILDKDNSRSDIGIYGGPFGESYKYLDLAPRVPINLAALVDTNYITLNWNRNTEADTSFYKVYRDTVISFAIDSTKLVSSSSDTSFVQINPHNVTRFVYKVTCIDQQGNESEPSEEIVVNITSVSVDDYPMTISDYRLYQNYPNPFNPSTTISYRLKERGYVKLYVYDIKGELISVLVNKTQEAGFYQVEFSSSSIEHPESGIPQSGRQNLASGIYIYQIHVIGENNIPVFTDFNKMILIK